MSKDRNRNQIIRKDARGCFVESLNDVFSIDKAHLAFVAYDLHSPAGQRQTDNIHIYLDIAELLELCRKAESGELRQAVQAKKRDGDKDLCTSAWAAPLRNGCGSWESPGPTAGAFPESFSCCPAAGPIFSWWQTAAQENGTPRGLSYPDSERNRKTT